MIERVYLDFCASTPVASEVSMAMEPFVNYAYGNPSSLHWAGVMARDGIDNSRSQVAALLGCDATEVIFTSGGTEANNFAIKGLIEDRKLCRTIRVADFELHRKSIELSFRQWIGSMAFNRILSSDHKKHR